MSESFKSQLPETAYKSRSGGFKIGEPNSPVKPNVEKGLKKLLKKKGISMKEFEKQFKKK